MQLGQRVGAPPYHAPLLSSPESLSASTRFLCGLQSENSRLHPLFLVIDEDVCQAVVNLDTLSDLSKERFSVVAYHLDSIGSCVSDVVGMKLSEMFGQGRLFGLIISDSCNMIQPSAIARAPSLTKLISSDTVFLTQFAYSMVQSMSSMMTAAFSRYPCHHVHQAVWHVTGLTCCQIRFEQFTL